MEEFEYFQMVVTDIPVQLWSNQVFLLQTSGFGYFFTWRFTYALTINRWTNHAAYGTSGNGYTRTVF